MKNWSKTQENVMNKGSTFGRIPKIKGSRYIYIYIYIYIYNFLMQF